MLNIRHITRREWNETPRDYRGITTILVCRHCGDWTSPWRPDLIPTECTAENGHEWEEREQKTMLGHDEKGTFLEFVEVVEMTEDAFAEFLGFDSYEELARASETIVLDGDVGWFITQLPDGRWAAWDDAELAPDRVEFFDTREEAIEFHQSLNVFARILIEWERAQRGLGDMVGE